MQGGVKRYKPENWGLRGPYQTPFRAIFFGVSTYNNQRGLVGLKREKLVHGATVLLMWTTLGVFSSLELRLESSFSPRPGSLAHAFVMELSFTTICALLTPAVLWLARRFRIDKRPYWPNALLHLFASVAFTIISKTIWYPFMLALDGREFTWLKFFWSIVYSFDYCVVLYWMVLLTTYLVEYYRRYQRGVIDAARLNGELAQAQLRWLKSRLHPHFLFNTLHTISALVREDPDSAERMIARLSDLLRLALQDSALQEVPLRQELEYLNLYLDIEKMRFEERLKVRFEIDPDVEEAMVPGLVLQPLVENAIRHGIGGRASGGTIQIIAGRDNGRLTLSIIDNGAGLRQDGQLTREGVGLSSARGRLDRLYGRSHSLVLRNLPGGGVEARITMPFITGEVDLPEVFHETISSVSSGRRVPGPEENPATAG